MSSESMIIGALISGVIATLIADVWVMLLVKLASIPRTNWGLVGRWVAGMRRGVFVHRRISDAPAVRGELTIGWLFHYAIGIAYGLLYAFWVRTMLGTGPTLVSALIFALVTLVAPWFIMQPALGLGFMA